MVLYCRQYDEAGREQLAEVNSPSVRLPRCNIQAGPRMARHQSVAVGAYLQICLHSPFASGFNQPCHLRAYKYVLSDDYRPHHPTLLGRPTFLSMASSPVFSEYSSLFTSGLLSHGAPCHSPPSVDIHTASGLPQSIPEVRHFGWTKRSQTYPQSQWPFASIDPVNSLGLTMTTAPVCKNVRSQSKLL